MIGTQVYLHNNTAEMGFGSQLNPAAIENKVRAMFQGAYHRAQLHQLAASALRRKHNLQDLETALKGHQILGQSSAGLRSVEIKNIRGSESRSTDFDHDFRPLQERFCSRWMSVARLVVKGLPLPPVELLKVGQHYFVRDGHHRISVAKALGQKAIDAEVTVLEVE